MYYRVHSRYYPNNPLLPDNRDFTSLSPGLGGNQNCPRDWFPPLFLRIIPDVQLYRKLLLTSRSVVNHYWLPRLLLTASRPIRPRGRCMTRYGLMAHPRGSHTFLPARGCMGYSNTGSQSAPISCTMDWRKRPSAAQIDPKALLSRFAVPWPRNPRLLTHASGPSTHQVRSHPQHVYFKSV